MIDDELTLASEQVGKRFFARGTFEYIGFLDLDPGQRAPRFTQLIAPFGEFLFFGKQRFACGQPFFL